MLPVSVAHTAIPASWKGLRLPTAVAITLLAALGISRHLAAAPHEIKVFADEIADEGEHTLEVHANFAKVAPGGIGDQRRILQLMPEYSYGIARNWEASLQLPAARVGDVVYGNGIRGEVQYVAPHNKSEGFYWGVNTEIAYSSPIAERQFWGIELVPIIGTRIQRWHFALNLGLELALTGDQRKVTFEPSAMAMYSVNPRNQLGFEYYVDLGPLRKFSSRDEQSHILYGVWNHDAHVFELNLGVGRGLTEPSDRWVIKAIIEFRFK